MTYKILIADDDVDFVEVLQARLEAEGYKVISANEGVRTVELAHKELPSLIILDWRMPAGKGGDVLKFLSTKNETKNIPVIVISGFDEPSIREKIETYKVRAYLRKPYDTAELLQYIRTILGCDND